MKKMANTFGHEDHDQVKVCSQISKNYKNARERPSRRGGGGGDGSCAQPRQGVPTLRKGRGMLILFEGMHVVRGDLAQSRNWGVMKKMAKSQIQAKADNPCCAMKKPWAARKPKQRTSGPEFKL